jgi:hypothetical protein
MKIITWIADMFVKYTNKKYVYGFKGQGGIGEASLNFEMEGGHHRTHFSYRISDCDQNELEAREVICVVDYLTLNQLRS